MNCHCGQCAKLNGSFGAQSKSARSNFSVVRNQGLAWYRISEGARRGFCHECGSGLFWDQLEQDTLGIIAGSLDRPNGLKTIGQIFVGDKPDLCEINDDIQQFVGSGDGKIVGEYP